MDINDFIEKSSAKNYIISGGLKEFLQNLKISKYFDDIYGTPVRHNERGMIVGIDQVMTDDRKLLAICDILEKNNRQKNDCRNVYYIGDGYSDAAAMRFVHSNGGKAIFVHQPNKDDKFYDYNNRIYEKLNVDGIVDFCCLADYTKGSELEDILQRQKAIVL